MGFEMTNQTTTQDNWVSDRRLWLTADKSTVVEDGDAGAAFLLCGGAGGTLPKAQAQELGLLKAPDPEVKMEAKPEDKAMAKPAAKKTAKKKTTKKKSAASQSKNAQARGRKSQARKRAASTKKRSGKVTRTGPSKKGG